MRRYFYLIFVSVFCLGVGGQQVGNGGDPLYLIMQKAKVDAVNIATRFSSADIESDEVAEQFDEDVYSLLLSNFEGSPVYLSLPYDIGHSQHEFLDSTDEVEQTTCALTNLPDRPQSIVFSLEHCRILLESSGQDFAIELLIHEAIHHFGVLGSPREESLATRTATQLVKFWQNLRAENAPQWTSLPLQNGPAARYQATSVKTGDDAFVVWGGCNYSRLPERESCEHFLNSGKLFQLDDNGGHWNDVTVTDAPSGRKLATGIFTGEQTVAAANNKVIVWGGCSGPTAGCQQSLNDGAIYDPSLDQWHALPPSGAPGRTRHTAVWTGNEMIIYGGLSGDETGLDPPILGDLRIMSFDEAGNWHWREVTVPGHFPPRFGHSAVWADHRLVVFGGCTEQGIFSCQSYANDAFTFDPATDEFEFIRRPNPGLAGRMYASAIWNGTDAIFWGGLTERNQTTNDGIMISLPAGEITPIHALLPSGEQSGRYLHQATWSGQAMYIYGGWTEEREFSQSTLRFSYLPHDPAQQAWELIDTPTQPIGRVEQTQVWTNKGLAIWGGYGARNTFLPTGGLLKNID